MVLGKEMLIVPFDRTMIKATKSNVFVKNLEPSSTNKSLYELFKPFGEIFSVKLAQDYKGVSKGFGYIQYFNPEDANKAIEAMNGKEIGDKKLIAEIYKTSSRNERESSRFTNVFVKDLPSDVQTEEALKKLFAKFGNITSVGIFSQEYKGKTGHYGFVNFAEAEDAAKAVTEMNNKTIGDAKLFVTRALTKDQREREKIKRKIELRNQSRKFTLHIKSAKGEPLSEESVATELSPYGEIKSVTIQKNKNADGTESNTAIGYVVFARSEDAEQAANAYRKDGPIIVNLLEGKEQRREKMKSMMRDERMEYGSMAPFMMRGMNQGMRRMTRGTGRGRGRGGATQRPFQRPLARPIIPGFGLPGRMPMAMPMMAAPYGGYMPGAPFGIPGQMGPIPGAIPGGMPGPGMQMMPGMSAMPGMQGMPRNMPPGVQMNPQMMHQMPQQFMTPVQPVQGTPAEREELGEQLYAKIEQIIDPEYSPFNI